MEYPKEPQFYPDKQQIIFTGDKNNSTLQSIDGTLKRIETILLDFQKKECYSPLKILQDAVAVSLSETKAIQEK